jgi:hypothetical protein
MPAVPSSENTISVQNHAGVAQTVVVATPNESVNQLTVGDAALPAAPTIALRVDAVNLSVASGTVVTANGDLELGNQSGNQGTLTSQSVTVQDGGRLVGNGTVVGNLNVGAGGGESSILRPGFSVGHVDVVGNYSQGSKGLLALDVEGSADGEFDTVDVTGNVILGGTLQIDATDLPSSEASDWIQIIRAGNLAGEFETVETIGSDDARFVVRYSGTKAEARSWSLGDMNGNGEINSEDVRLFVLALMNPAKFPDACNCDDFGQFGGDFPRDGRTDGRVDFYDIAPFNEAMANEGVSTSTFVAALEEYFSTVPEPSPAVLAVATVAFAMVKRRRPCSVPAFAGAALDIG